MAVTLPLVAFERYMLAEDTREYPRAFVLKVTLAGNLERKAFEAAWPAALARHPLLMARLDSNEQSWVWLEGNSLPAAIDWGQENEPLKFSAGEKIDLKNEPG